MLCANARGAKNETNLSYSERADVVVATGEGSAGGGGGVAGTGDGVSTSRTTGELLAAGAAAGGGGSVGGVDVAESLEVAACTCAEDVAIPLVSDDVAAVEEPVGADEELERSIMAGFEAVPEIVFCMRQRPHPCAGQPLYSMKNGESLLSAEMICRLTQKNRNIIARIFAKALLNSPH